MVWAVPHRNIKSNLYTITTITSGRKNAGGRDNNSDTVIKSQLMTNTISKSNINSDFNRHCNIMITLDRISKRSCILIITSKRNHLRHITHKTTNNRNCSRNRDV